MAIIHIQFRPLPDVTECELRALAWTQTEEDRAAIAEFFAEERAVAAGEAYARVIEGTETRNERLHADTAIRQFAA